MLLINKLLSIKEYKYLHNKSRIHKLNTNKHRKYNNNIHIQDEIDDFINEQLIRQFLTQHDIRAFGICKCKETCYNNGCTRSVDLLDTIDEHYIY
jgi:hypothetical protein